MTRKNKEDDKAYSQKWYLENKDKVSRQSKEWYEANKEHKALLQRRYYYKLRESAHGRLGNKCARCGFDDGRILQVDHINGGGSGGKRTLGRNMRPLYKEICEMTEQDMKKKYQLLCPNCNWIKRIENNEIHSKHGVYHGS